MYVYVYAMRACMYVCIYVCMYVINVCMYVCLLYVCNVCMQCMYCMYVWSERIRECIRACIAFQASPERGSVRFEAS